MAIIRANNNTLSSVTSLPSGVGGKVLQVVKNLVTTKASTTTSIPQDTGEYRKTPRVLNLQHLQLHHKHQTALYILIF